MKEDNEDVLALALILSPALIFVLLFMILPECNNRDIRYDKNYKVNTIEIKDSTNLKDTVGMHQNNIQQPRLKTQPELQLIPSPIREVSHPIETQIYGEDSFDD